MGGRGIQGGFIMIPEKYFTGKNLSSFMQAPYTAR